MQNLTIRRATPNDVELISILGSTTFYDTFNGTCTITDMNFVLDKFFNKKQVAIELNDEKDFFFIAFDDNEKALGYYRIKLQQHDHPFEALNNFNAIELKRLYCINEAKGKGVAKALIEHAFDFATAHGYNKMYLSVWQYNIRAQEFYKKMGFKTTGIENDFPLGSTPQTDYWFWKDI
jgi:ribosomal protein S18 acetylase RimI-like enzyme